MRRVPVAVYQIERLRALRVKPPRPLDIAGEVIEQIREVRRSSARAADRPEQLWGGVIPQDLLASAVVTLNSRGTLTIKAGNASAAFALQRWLSSGGKDAIVRARPGVRAVRVQW